MILIETQMNAEAQTLTITIPSTDSAPSSTHSISLVRPDPATFPEEDHHFDIQVWASTTDGYAVGSPELIQALSAFMGRPVLLVQKGEELREASYDGFIYSIPAAEGGASFDYGTEEAPSIKFNDEYPLHIVTQESLHDLDRRVMTDTEVQKANGSRFDAEKWKDGGVEAVRFRPNVVLEGTRAAWDEDWWLDLAIGEGEDEVPLLVAQRCGRCQVSSAARSRPTCRAHVAPLPQLPNVDPETAIRDPVTPDKFMEKDRHNFPAIAHKLTFGVQTVPRKSLGRISVGDRVKVVGRYTEKRPDGTVLRFEDIPYLS